MPKLHPKIGQLLPNDICTSQAGQILMTSSLAGLLYSRQIPAWLIYNSERMVRSMCPDRRNSRAIVLRRCRSPALIIVDLSIINPLALQRLGDRFRMVRCYEHGKRAS